jgi:uncharacterized protein with HEPN domain
MSRERTYTDYLRDMLAHAQQAQAFVQGMTFEQFAADARTQAAVLWSLSIIGEAANRIPDSLQNQYPGVPWAPIVGMRNRLIHAYPTTNVQIVWDTVQRDLPGLIAQVAQMVQDLAQPETEADDTDA